MRSHQDVITVEVKPRSSRVGVEVRVVGRGGLPRPAAAQRVPETSPARNISALELVIRVHAPAVGRAANREMIELLARAAGVPKSTVHILHGERSRTKRVLVEGLSATELAGRLSGNGLPASPTTGREGCP